MISPTTWLRRAGGARTAGAGLVLPALARTGWSAGGAFVEFLGGAVRLWLGIFQCNDVVNPHVIIPMCKETGSSYMSEIRAVGLNTDPCLGASTRTMELDHT